MFELLFMSFWLHDCGFIKAGNRHEFIMPVFNNAGCTHRKNAIAPQCRAMEVEWAILDSNQ
jgi:hypothetical protein